MVRRAKASIHGESGSNSAKWLLGGPLGTTGHGITADHSPVCPIDHMNHFSHTVWTPSTDLTAILQFRASGKIVDASAPERLWGAKYLDWTVPHFPNGKG